MAKQVGQLLIEGCIDNVCFYKLEGSYYARMKSSLSGKRVKKDPAFAGTMKSANLLGRASSLVSPVFQRLSKTERDRDLFRQLTGFVKGLLKEGTPVEEVQALLLDRLEGLKQADRGRQ